MNIALLSYEYPPDTGFGGIGTYTYYHARALVKLGHRVHVFAGGTTPGMQTTEHDGVLVTRTRHEGRFHRWIEPARTWRWYWFHNRLDNAYAQYLALREAAKRTTFDVVEAPECGADAAAVSTLLNIPVAVRFHSPAQLIMDSYPTPRGDRRMTALVEQWAIDRATVRTSCSRFLAAEVRERMGVPAPIHVIPNGLDLELFDRDDPGDVRRQFGIPEDALTVLFANRLERRKGIHLLADIAIPLLQQFRHLHFVLAGRDLFEYVVTEVQPRLAALGLADRLHLLGALPLPQVRSLLKRVDMFMLPSMWENCPYSCLEAMAARLPIVSSDCGGMPELLENGRTGILARTGDPAAFVAGLQELIESPSMRLALGSAARAAVEHRLTDVIVAQQTVDVYEGTLALPARWQQPGEAHPGGAPSAP